MKKTRTKLPKQAQLDDILKRVNQTKSRHSRRLNDHESRLDRLERTGLTGIGHINPWRKG